MQAWLSSIGFPASIELDGQMHRVSVRGTRGKTGWYIGWRDPVVTVVAGDWRTGERWKYGEKVPHSAKQMVDARIAIMREDAARERGRKQELVAMKAKIILDSLPTTGSNVYLAKKQVAALGVYFDGADLLVPVRDAMGKTWGYQRVLQDGAKLFQSGGKTKGCFHVIEGDERVYVAEGYATAASVHMATGGTVYCAYHAGNLEEVARKIKGPLTICGDDDQWTPGNPGRSKAQVAASAVGGRVLFPEFKELSGHPTDFNDLHCREGLDVLAVQLKKLNP